MVVFSVSPLRVAPSSSSSPSPRGEVGADLLQQVRANPLMANVAQPEGTLPITSEVSSLTLPSNEGIVELLPELLVLWGLFGSPPPGVADSAPIPQY